VFRDPGAVGECAREGAQGAPRPRVAGPRREKHCAAVGGCAEDSGGKEGENSPQPCQRGRQNGDRCSQYKRERGEGAAAAAGGALRAAGIQARMRACLALRAVMIPSSDTSARGRHTEKATGTEGGGSGFVRRMVINAGRKINTKSGAMQPPEPCRGRGTQ